jgi:hypothetical protein
MCLKKGRAGAALALLRIAKSCDRRIWWFQTPLRQFEGELNQHIFRALESKLNGPITERDAFYQALCLLDMQPGKLIFFSDIMKSFRHVLTFLFGFL